MERVEWTTDPDALVGAGVVVEAVVEDAALKGQVFQTLDRLLGEDVILASNTSSIPIAQLASWTDHPQRVVGLHFFSPVPVQVGSLGVKNFRMPPAPSLSQ